MHARALPSVPGHVPIWANFVVYGPILKISNAMCISNGNLEFSPQMTHYACPVGSEVRKNHEISLKIVKFLNIHSISYHLKGLKFGLWPCGLIRKTLKSWHFLSNICNIWGFWSGNSVLLQNTSRHFFTSSTADHLATHKCWECTFQNKLPFGKKK